MVRGLVLRMYRKKQLTNSNSMFIRPHRLQKKLLLKRRRHRKIRFLYTLIVHQERILLFDLDIRLHLRFQFLEIILGDNVFENDETVVVELCDGFFDVRWGCGAFE